MSTSLHHPRKAERTTAEGAASAAAQAFPAQQDAADRPTLVLTVDTEEEGLWGGRYRMTGNTVENIGGIPRFQAVCDRLGIRPTYLVDAPVVQDDRASAILGEIHAEGRCEIGAHVHPWCNPPIDEQHDRVETYLCNLPVDVQRAKIEWLTEAISQRFGKRPMSFRAGRYGLDIQGARILSDLGYRVDSSVIPFTDYSEQGGPDFSDAPWRPYRVGGDDLRQPHESGNLVEVPVSVGFNRRDFARSMRLQKQFGHDPLRKLRLEGILDRTGLLKRIKLSPEQATARAMKTLIDRYCDAPSAVLVMMFHSSSLMPGQSPYVRDQSELDCFLNRIAKVCEYCFGSKSGVPSTLEDIALHSGMRTIPATA